MRSRNETGVSPAIPLRSSSDSRQRMHGSSDCLPQQIELGNVVEGDKSLSCNTPDTQLRSNSRKTRSRGKKREEMVRPWIAATPVLPQLLHYVNTSFEACVFGTVWDIFWHTKQYPPKNSQNNMDFGLSYLFWKSAVSLSCSLGGLSLPLRSPPKPPLTCPKEIRFPLSPYSSSSQHEFFMSLMSDTDHKNIFLKVLLCDDLQDK